MQSQPTNTQNGYQLPFYILVLAGGGLGGYAGFAFVALVFLPWPGVFSVFGIDGLSACGLGMLVGLLPGIGAYVASRSVENRGMARLAVFATATAAAMLVLGFLTAFFGAAAYV